MSHTPRSEIGASFNYSLAGRRTQRSNTLAYKFLRGNSFWNPLETEGGGRKTKRKLGWPSQGFQRESVDILLCWKANPVFQRKKTPNRFPVFLFFRPIFALFFGTCTFWTFSLLRVVLSPDRPPKNHPTKKRPEKVLT